MNSGSTLEPKWLARLARRRRYSCLALVVGVLIVLTPRASARDLDREHPTVTGCGGLAPASRIFSRKLNKCP